MEQFTEASTARIMNFWLEQIKRKDRKDQYLDGRLRKETFDAEKELSCYYRRNYLYETKI